MMKGFLKVSKLMGLMLLASGLLFAGCAPGGDDSTESAVTDRGGFIIPVTVDTAKLTMEVGDGAGFAIGDWGGHQVKLLNTGACGGGQQDATCTIRVTNLDPTDYMANTYIMLSFCTDCSGGNKTFSNADLSNGIRVGVIGDPSGTGGSADINGAGFCVVEDGDYLLMTSPYNYSGCTTVYTKQANKPYQFIHPDCGTRDIKWNFWTNDGTPFRFYVNIAAEWYPENPAGDGRFDWQNKITYYLTLNSLLDDKISGLANKGWWRLGSYKRSSALTGYGSGGADFSPAVGRYFALNVLAEYPNRIESYPVGWAPTRPEFQKYEYYNTLAWIIRYDPTVVRLLTADGPTKLLKNGGTNLYAGGLDQCNRTLNFCMSKSSTFTGFSDVPSATVSDPGAGYVFSYVALNQVPFAWNLSYDTYKTTAGVIMVGGYADLWPVFAGHVGLAKVNMVGTTVTGGGNPVNWYLPTALIPGGTPDPEPEVTPAMYYFKVLPGTSGRGTQFYADMFSSEAGAFVSIMTDHPGESYGLFTGSKDWAGACIPPTAGFDASMGCATGSIPTDYYVYTGIEVSNPGITHSGAAVPGGGSYQYWNVHLCVL